MSITLPPVPEYDEPILLPSEPETPEQQFRPTAFDSLFTAYAQDNLVLPVDGGFDGIEGRTDAYRFTAFQWTIYSMLHTLDDGDDTNKSSANMTRHKLAYNALIHDGLSSRLNAALVIKGEEDSLVQKLEIAKFVLDTVRLVPRVMVLLVEEANKKNRDEIKQFHQDGNGAVDRPTLTPDEIVKLDKNLKIISDQTDYNKVREAHTAYLELAQTGTEGAIARQETQVAEREQLNTEITNLTTQVTDSQATKIANEARIVTLTADLHRKDMDINAFTAANVALDRQITADNGR